MSLKLEERSRWHEELAASIRAGRFERAAALECRGVHHVVGIGQGGFTSRPYAKYSDVRRAEDAVLIIHRLAGLN